MADKVAMLIDLTKCVGCRACQVACKEWNGLEGLATSNRGTYENPPVLGYETWTKIEFVESGGPEGVDWNFFKRQCVHCTLSLIHISEPTRRTPISYAVFCLKK